VLNLLSAGTALLFFLALTSPTNGGHSVGILRLQTKAMELVFLLFFTALLLLFTFLSAAKSHSTNCTTIIDHPVMNAL
jgi:hypothetical protein